MKNLKKVILAALFAALTCAATFSIRIPTVLTAGYIHPGDAIVILSGVFLGPVYGAAAAAVGSAMSDLLGGYFIYVPITFLIKGTVAFLTGKAFAYLKQRDMRLGVLAGGVIDTVVVVFGYALCEAIIYTPASALVNMLPNMVQGLSGLVLSLILFQLLASVPDFKRMLAATYQSRR